MKSKPSQVYDHKCWAFALGPKQRISRAATHLAAFALGARVDVAAPSREALGVRRPNTLFEPSRARTAPGLAPFRAAYADDTATTTWRRGIEVDGFCRGDT